MSQIKHLFACFDVQLIQFKLLLIGHKKLYIKDGVYSGDLSDHRLIKWFVNWMVVWIADTKLSTIQMVVWIVGSCPLFNTPLFVS